MTHNFKYEVVGRCLDGVTVLGYYTKELSSGKIALLNREAIEKMALDKLIKNVTAQFYDGRVMLKGTDIKLNSLPCFDAEGNRLERQTKVRHNNQTLMLSARILDGRTIIGYVIDLIEDGMVKNRKQITREQAIELAREGRITNARVQMSNGIPVLRGVNCELARLDSVKNVMV